MASMKTREIPVDVAALFEALALSLGLSSEFASAFGRVAAAAKSNSERIRVSDLARLYGRTPQWAYAKIRDFGMRTSPSSGPHSTTVNFAEFVRLAGPPRGAWTAAASEVAE